ncbi:DUF6090 family protein [Salinimicrobium soli]|uniref:DUF6090 family protein n=1 Tax=Salinimicrobium soli TaxID=1254399 RepID=UPI003AABE669
MGKTKKYLAYAMGEIMLVVVGILIALQVNNWNEERKNENRKQRYLQSLVMDLENDLDEIDSLMNSAVLDTTRLGNLRKRISSPNAKLDTLIHIYRYELNPIITDAAKFKTTTFEAIEASGDINLFSAETIEKLTILNKLQQAHLDFSLQDLSQYKRSINVVIKKYPSPMYSGSMKIHSPMSQKVWNSIEAADFISDLNGLIIVKYLSNQLYLQRSEEIKKYTEKLLQELQKKSEAD